MKNIKEEIIKILGKDGHIVHIFFNFKLSFKYSV